MEQSKGKGTRWSAVFAVGLGLFLLGGVVVQCIVAVLRPGLFAAHNDVPNALVGVLGDGLGEILVGTVLASRLPRNPIGWSLLGFGASTDLITGAGAIAEAGYRTGHPSLLAQVALVVSSVAAEGILVTFVVVVALFPSGRIVERSQRILLTFFWFALAVFTVPLLLAPHLTAGSGRSYPNPIGLQGAGFIQSVGTGGIGLPFLTFVLVFAVDAVRRWLRSQGVERQQMKVFGYSVVAWFVILACGSAIPSESAWSNVGWTVGSNLIAVAIGAAVLRYRLYDLDRIVSRTVSYAVVTGVLVGVYVGMIALTNGVLPFSSSVGVAASTLAAAALFNPLRHRIQHTVDRRFNRARYNAEATAGAFADRLRATADLGGVDRDLMGIVAVALQPQHLSLWLAR